LRCRSFDLQILIIPLLHLYFQTLLMKKVTLIAIYLYALLLTFQCIYSQNIVNPSVV
jgi:hypothetical protein